MSGTKLVVGLGNPGPRYQETRHNVGFRVVAELAHQEGWKLRPTPWWRSGRGRLAGSQVVLAQPLTFMNDSGRAVLGLLQELGLGAGELMVVCDDLNLELGCLRLRRAGSSGGHKGLASVVRYLGGEDFTRLRLGLGSPVGEAVEFVLSPFEPGERPVIDQAVAQAADALCCWVADGIEEAMNRYNRKPGQPQGEARETV